MTPSDRGAIAQHLRERWGLESTSPPPETTETERRTRFAAYARRVSDRFTRPQRLALIERLWMVAFSEGGIGMSEDRLCHLATELLGVGPADLAEARRQQSPTASRP